MNVFWREVNARRKSLFFWSIGMAVLVVMSFVKYDSLMQTDSQAVRQLFDDFPSAVKAMFGMSELDPTTLAGYYVICYLLYALMLAVHAGLLGSQLINDEETDRTVEFLYVRPISRTRILLRKVAAGIALMAALWGVTAAANYASITAFADMNGFTADFWLLMAASAIIQLTFFAIGVMAATGLRRFGPARAVSLAVFGSYLLYILSQLGDSVSWLHYGSVFSYFDGADIIHDGALKLHYTILCLVGSVLLIAIGAVLYQRRDLNT